MEYPSIAFPHYFLFQSLYRLWLGFEILSPSHFLYGCSNALIPLLYLVFLMLIFELFTSMGRILPGLDD